MAKKRGSSRNQKPASGSRNTSAGGSRHTPAGGSRHTPAGGSRHTPAGGSRHTPAGGSRHTPAYGCLFWLVLLAVIVAVGVAAREPLTQAITRYFGNRSESAQRPQAAPAAKPPAVEEPAPAVRTVPPAREHESAPAVSRPTEPSPGAAAGAKTTVPQQRPPEKPVLRRARLYFLSAKPDGTSALAPIDRDLPQSDSPLRDALESLLAGPDATEKTRGMTSSIPADARLRSVVVRDGTAYLDFSESFRFTASGVEGLTAQLHQVVATTTAFPTVSRVQILIEGRKVQYLGTEGVRVDEPLTPASFSE